MIASDIKKCLNNTDVDIVYVGRELIVLLSIIPNGDFLFTHYRYLKYIRTCSIRRGLAVLRAEKDLNPALYRDSAILGPTLSSCLNSSGLSSHNLCLDALSLKLGF